MKISKYFGIQIVLIFLIKVSASKTLCNWKLDVDCWLLCSNKGTIAEVTHSIDEQWAERPQCHADGIALGLYNVAYTNFTVQANWFEAKVKVKYLEFGMSGVNVIEEGGFSSDAFKSVKHLVVPNMDLYVLKKGLFKGLVSLEIMNLKGASLIQTIEMGILDELQSLKELTFERHRLRDRKNQGRPLPIDALAGSNQTIDLEFMRVRYYIHQLTNQSFVGLKKIKYLDLSYCGIEYINEGAFDSIIDTVKILRLTNNPLQQMASGIFDLIPTTYDTYIFMGENEKECECLNLPINFIVRTGCGENEVVDKLCRSIVPPEGETNLTTSITTITTTTTRSTTTPTTISVQTTTNNPPPSRSIQPTQTEATWANSINESSMINAVPPTLKAEIKEFKYGDVIVYLDAPPKANSKLSLFGPQSDKHGSPLDSIDINCPIDDSNIQCSIPVKNLKRNYSYTFCVTNTFDDPTELFPCTEYTIRGPSYFQLKYNNINLIMIAIVIIMIALSLFLLWFYRIFV